jgi:peptide/nickel transport system permease protein
MREISSEATATDALGNRASSSGFYRSPLRLGMRALARDRLALCGIAVILVVCSVSVLAPWISPYDPTLAASSVGRLAPMGTPGHLLGTDSQGRDILSRIIWGGRVSLMTAVLPVLVSAVGGLVIGVLAGMAGRRVSGLVMRSLDVLFAFPPVLLALAVATVLGPGMMNVMMAIAIVSIPYMARVVYVEVLSVRASDYIEAARVAGTPPLRLLVRELLPNVLPPLVVYATTGIGGLIVMAAGLSFLGVGVQPPTADWGIMVADGRLVLRQAPHVASVPGILIMVTALAFSAAGDGIRDAMDPRRRSGHV